MTPAARVAAAIEILDDMTASGLAAEQALTRWARRSRFAGSKDRSAVRDHVFDVMRCRRTAAHFGKGESGRSLMIGLLLSKGENPDTLFNGEGHGPAPLTAEEAEVPPAPQARGVRWNLPDWLLPEMDRSLGAQAESCALALQDRAPVTLRVNAARASRGNVQSALAQEGIETVENSLCETALTVIEGARRLRQSVDYLEGRVELQDAASQAVVAALPSGGRVLDYCAGGGGKALALAAAGDRSVFAHDIDPGRMADLPARATRAGAEITLIDGKDIEDAAPFDVVLCDAPCSGSGAWRRAPEGKWTLTAERLDALTAIQDSILDRAGELVTTGGTLGFATCSVLKVENEDRIAAFIARHTGWHCTYQRRFDVGPEGDGFFTAHLMRG